MSVTIRTVAEEAGVSPATVSRAFNDTAPVEPETREHVLEVADRLGYVPNATARSLSLKTNNTFGVLLPYLTGEYFPEVIRGLDRTAREEGRLLMLSSSHYAKEDLRRALSSMHGRIDGLVLMLPRMPREDYNDLLPDDLPVVLLNSDPEGHQFGTLSIDNRAGARLATRHLIELGHERIGIITGDPANREARWRLQGYQSALAEADLPCPSTWTAEGNFERHSGAEAVRTLMEAAPALTAVFASNDYMAMGAIQALQEDGYQVPGDVSVVGFDDIPSARHFSPALTTVDARMMDLGTKAITMLIEQLDGGTLESRARTLQPRLQRRTSAQPPGRTDPR